MKKIFDSAMQFLNMGISVFPLYHRSKTPMLASWEPYKTTLPTENELLNWFSTDWNNYGVIAGWCNLVVLDFDNLFYFTLWSEWMRSSKQDHILDTSFKVITGNGMHVYLRTSELTHGRKRISKKGGIDVQGVGRYVVGPGCVHPSGYTYQPVGEMRLIEIDCIDTVLPVDLFPYVSQNDSEYNGMAPEIHSNNTEYLDTFSFAGMDLISKVKSMVRIETFYTGIQKSSVGDHWLKALCPFHDDKKQSAWIDVQRQIAGCQVCGMLPMDCINVYARMKGIDNRTAVTALAEEAGIWR